MAAMNAFTDLSDEEQIRELVEYTGTLLGDGGAAFVTAHTPATMDKKQAAGILKDLIAQSHTYFTGNQTPAEIESTFNSIARLLRVLPETDNLVRELAQVLASPEHKGHELSRLKVLGNLFNNLESSSQSRYDTYLQVVQLAGRSGNVRSIIGQLGQVDAWAAEWKLSSQQKRALYKLLHEVLTAHSFKQESIQFLLKFLKSFEDGTPEELASVKPQAEYLVKEVLASEEELFEGSTILGLKAVQQLKGSDLHEVLEKYVAGDLAGLDAWLASHRQAVTSIGFQEAELRRKVQLSTLTKMCSDASSLEFSEIAAKLKVPEDDIEPWMIDVIRAGLVEAKIDQLNKKVLITRSSHRDFAASQWAELKAQLEAWQENIGQVQEVVETVRKQAQAQVTSAPSGR